jgi:DNA-binding Lrp family transcriptional regulator
MEPQAIELGKRPRIKRKQHVDRRMFTVVPRRAFLDRKLMPAALRVLGCLCSYANRAGLTWVGQKRVGTDLGVSFQAVHRQVKKLKQMGYVELVRRGWAPERCDTLRIIYDPSIDTETAIALAGGIEEVRPPDQIEREEELIMGRKPKAVKQAPVAKRERVEVTPRVTVDQALKGMGRVTESDLLAIERAIEAGLTLDQWEAAKEKASAQTVQAVLACI